MTSPPLVAVLDSGLHPQHPHVAGLRARGFALTGEAGAFRQDPDFSDCTGHGTAVTAALHRMLPETEVLAVRLLDAELRCSSAALAEGIRRAAAEGARVINLSLGTRDPEAADALADAVAEAAERGAICVAAAHPRDADLWPAALDTVISAQAHRDCPLGDLFRIPGPSPAYMTHGFPRPIEGLPPTQNFFGPSFAAIHVSARVAAFLQQEPEAGLPEAVAHLDAACSGEWHPAT